MTPHVALGSASDPTRSWELHGFRADADALLAEQTLPHAWARRWIEQPGASALIDPSGTELTYGDLGRIATATAVQLLRHGVTTNSRILVSATPSIDLITLHVALLLVGAVVVPVNTAFTDVEVANIAAEAAVTMAILSDPTRSSQCQPQIEVLDVRLTRWGGVNPTDADLFDPSVIDAIHGQSPAMLLFTSGTTGRPKGALLSHANLLASAAALVASWAWTAGDRLVLCLPLFHMHGLGVGVHGTLLAGASVVVLPGFAEDAVFDTVRDHRSTLLFGVPTMWTRLSTHPRVSELSPLRLCVSGSAPLAPEVWHTIATRAGQQIIERYGMTETVMLTSNPLVGSRKPGTVGLALPGVGVKLREPGNDGVGEIVVRGPNVFAGYLDRPEANMDAFVEGCWFRTGDLGRFDADGYLSIVGRSKDLIITGGYNVYPSDVEAVLRSHESIAEVAVIGEPSTLWGETVTACLVLNAATDATTTHSSHHAEVIERVLTFGAEHLAPYQRPRRVVIVDTLPRNALGKVLKAVLAEQVKPQPPQ